MVFGAAWSKLLMSSLGSSDARSSCIVVGYQEFGFLSWKAPSYQKGFEG